MTMYFAGLIGLLLLGAVLGVIGAVLSNRQPRLAQLVGLDEFVRESLTGIARGISPNPKITQAAKR